MTIEEYIEMYGDNFQYTNAYMDPDTYMLVNINEEDEVSEELLQVGFLQSSPPPFWIQEPDPNDNEGSRWSPNAYPDWVRAKEIEIIDNLDKKIEKWRHETGHRYMAISNYRGATVFKVQRITDKAVLIDTDTWIPFKECEIAEGFPPFSQSSNLDFVVRLPDWFLMKEKAFNDELEKGIVSYLDFELDLKVHFDYRESVIDNYLVCKGEIPPYDKEFAAKRAGISGNKKARDNSYYGRVAIIHSLQKRGLEPFPSF